MINKDKLLCGQAGPVGSREITMAEQAEQTTIFNEAQGQALVRLARQTIAAELGRPVAAVVPDILADPALQARHGTFVTLHLSGALRGCIGSLVALEPLVDGVRRNAMNAAFQDPRFSPLTVDELNELDIEVSVLTDPAPLEYKDGADLLAKLRPNIDGVIIRQGHAAATFLPQVWDQLPEPADFLAHLCRKAGLPMDAWQQGNLVVSTYQVQYFSEKP